ncbi:glutamate/tyrosine decarboxylase-like PLP-dependent enzyme [Sphingopyxis panaciterrae]|uniref:pyridoxal phosphate-dependent decarboxylase family protein n=1 Tax=Sphingopyxis panaciterrae TaxID=363841 RepID=UPI00141F31BB|nr:aminotransferase class I/II-fold pyridoxal phosphate-dependent enzyme [Sphingopyxis panaciterrae]NIJ38915.1 glutamate/tyrosine decarboxylase-like PLP-dependent enzyme [Sphingopyxis panaciterrae]
MNDEIGAAVRDVLARLTADRARGEPIVSIASADEAIALRALAVPKAGRPIAAVIDDAERVFAHRVRMDHPRFYGFIPSPASPLSLVGEMLASGYNAHAGSWMQSSGPAAIEQGLIAWLAERAGLPDSAGGLFVSGGSMANLTGLMLARDRMLPPGERHRGVAYVSTQTHSSVAKGLGVLGLLPGQIRKVAVDADRRLDVAALAGAVAADRAAGKLPFVVIASCGTTNTGSIDDLHAIADLAGRERLWLHVDGAYGASVALSGSHRALVNGLGRADSLSWDAHKWLFQTYGCGMVLVRDRMHLLESFATSAEYLQDAAAGDDTPNFWDYGVELTRPARAMKLWFTLQVMGARAVGEAIDHGFELAAALEEALRERPHWRIVSPAQLGIVTFRYAPPGRDANALDALNTAIARRMIDDNAGAPLTTRLDDAVVLRACTISPEATVGDIRAMVADLDARAVEMAGAGRQ